MNLVLRYWKSPVHNMQIGELEVTVGEESLSQLCTSDAIFFNADAPHLAQLQTQWAMAGPSHRRLELRRSLLIRISRRRRLAP